MANWYEPTPKQKKAWEKWLKGRPAIIQEMGRKFPLWGLYLLKSSGHRVFPYSYNENGTLTVVVSGTFNLVGFERKVFGIPQDDLEPCDLPEKGEEVGVLWDDERTRQHINEARAKNGLPPLTKDKQ